MQIKTTLFFWTVLLLMAASAASQPTIELITNLTLKGFQLKDYKVAVYKSSSHCDTITVVNGKPAFLSLEPEKNYTLFFVKDTFDAECIIVQTHIPADIKPKKYRVFVNVEIDPIQSKQTAAGEDFPSAIISFNRKLKHFEYLKQYHKQVHN